MALKKQFNLKVILFLLIVVSNSACKHKQTDSKALKTQWKAQNMQILRDLVKEKCETIQKTTFLSHKFLILDQIPLKEKLIDSAVIRIYTSRIKPSFLEKAHIFSEENISYCLKQLRYTNKISYVDNIQNKFCVITKDEVPEEVLLMPGDKRTMSVSKVVFTENNQYAFFLMGSESISVFVIYKNKNGVFIFCKSFLLGVS